MYHIKDFDVRLHLDTTQLQNNSIHGLLNILDSESILIPDILTISRELQWYICCFCWFVISVGTYFRHILYKCLVDRYKKKDFKPIDLLTLILTVTHHLSIVCHAILITVMIVKEANAVDIVGQWYCELSRFLALFDMFYSTVGSLGLALYRLIYIRFHQFSMNGGEKKSCYFILFSGLAVSAIFVVLLEIDDYAKTRDENCILIPKPLFLSILDEYEISRQNSSIYQYWIDIRAFLGFVGVCLNTTELIIYFNVFYILYKHDNNELLRRLLDPSVTTKRNRTNAITFFGQFCSFVVEISVIISVIISTKIHAWFMVFALKYAGFAAMSIVEVMTSNALRSRLFGN